MYSSPLLETRGLTIVFDGFAAVNGVDYRLDPGEVAGIIGPNGAGKSTFFNLLTGFYTPTEGQVHFQGRDISKLSPNLRVGLGLARTFQLASVITSLTALQNVLLSTSRTCQRRIGRFCLGSPAHEAVEQAMEAIRKVGLEGQAQQVVAELSYGDRRKIEIAMALALNPSVLLLDEPFAGLSEAEIGELLNLLQRLKGQFALVVIEHKISRLVSLVERLSVMHEGRLIADGKPEEVLRDPVVQQVYWNREAGRTC
ncbi:MAG: ABC transporter ATP-binding protein [Betaproteobacteria bacterium]